MNLFKKEKIKLSSGKISDFKIECDVFTDEDWECLAYLISKKIKFKSVKWIPTGGNKLAEYLLKYRINDKSLPLLICDDVLTTGNSMENLKGLLIDVGVKNKDIKGVVIFARGKCPNWITPLFPMC